MKLSRDDLKVGEFYRAVYNDIVVIICCKSPSADICHALNITFKMYRARSCNNRAKDYYPATQEEIDWLRACIKANDYVTPVYITNSYPIY